MIFLLIKVSIDVVDTYYIYHRLTGIHTMAKPKQRQLMVAPSKDKSTPIGPEAEPPGEESWVIVKKQIVRILIPPIPANKHSTTPDLGPTQGRAIPIKTTNTQSDYPMETHVHSVDERERYVSLAANKGFPTARRSPRPIQTFSKLPRKDFRVGTKSTHQVESIGFRKTLGVWSGSRVSKRPLNFVGVDAFVNHRMRASNLDRKLQRAGGLSRWLASLGLDRFVKIFQGKNVNKFQLVNLTMKKLKDMGADAVGPRRKLMHAIDCLCQPYCFEVL